LGRWRPIDTPAPATAGPLRDENGQSAKSAQFQERDYRAAVLDCRREWRDVPVNHSRPRRVASFQSRLLPLGNEPEQMWTESTRNLLDSLLWSGLPVKKIS
jgi:hypothetical protein